MTRHRKYQFFLAAVLLLLFAGGFVQIASAQVEQDTLRNIKSDTTQVKQELNQKNQKIIRHYRFDRSTHKYLTTESSRYNVPKPTKPYKPPLTAQKSVDEAVKALNKRNKLGRKLMNSRIYRILARIIPFIPFLNHAFNYGDFNPVVPVISPNNPYLYPQTIEGQAWWNFMQSRTSPQPEKDKPK